MLSLSHRFNCASSNVFTGAKPGFVFKTGQRGRGFYKDIDNDFQQSESTLLKAPLASSAQMVLLYHHQQDHKPRLVEIVVPLGEMTGVTRASDLKIDITDFCFCVISSKYWSSVMTIPLHYSVHVENAQAWFHDKELTLRFPISAC